MATTVRSRRLIWMMAAVAVSLSAGAQTDTLKVIRQAQSVVITRCDSTTRVIVSGVENDSDYRFSYEVNVDGEKETSAHNGQWMPRVPVIESDSVVSKSGKFRKSYYIYLRDIYVGALLPLDAPNGIDPSVDYGINCLVGLAYTPWRRGPEFSIGLGMMLRRLSIHNGMMAGKEGDALVLLPRPDEYSAVRSSINSFALTIPMMMTQRLGSRFGCSVGAVANLNTYASAQSEYKVGYVENKINYKNLQQRIFTVDLMATLCRMGSDGAFGFYVKYSPMHMFRTGYGPEFTMISAGVTFGL